MTKESLECLTMQNDSLKSLYKNLQDELSVIEKNIYSPFIFLFNLGCSKANIESRIEIEYI